jgi:hypothetical protein
MKNWVKMTKLIEKIKHNHSVMMLLCCGIPLVILFIGVYFFGLSNKYIYWFAIALCPVMHFFMMKDMHKNHIKGKGEKENCH